MRQVDRVRVQVWLKCLDDDGVVGTADLTREALSLSEALHLINTRYNRIVLVWQELDMSFRVQVLPKRLADGRLSGPVGMSYGGMKLISLVRLACLELRLLHDSGVAWEGSNREVVRWVA